MTPSIDNYTTHNQKFIGSAYATVPETKKDFWSTASTIFYTEEADYPKVNQREIKLLEEYKQLDDNWDDYGAKAPAKNAILLAEYIVRAMETCGQRIFHVAPGARGEILVDIRNKNKSIELLFYPNTAKYVRFSENHPPDQGVFQFTLLPELLEWLNG